MLEQDSSGPAKGEGEGRRASEGGSGQESCRRVSKKQMGGCGLAQFLSECRCAENSKEGEEGSQTQGKVQGTTLDIKIQQIAF